MPRELPAALESIMVQPVSDEDYRLLIPANQPYIKAFLRTSATSTSEAYPLDVLGYELDGLDLTVKCPTPASNWPTAFISLRRGYYIDDEPVTIETTNFFMESFVTAIDGITIYHGTLFPPDKKISLAADLIYYEVALSVAAQLGYTAEVSEPTDNPFWFYKFYPAGKGLRLNKISYFLKLLRQKYFINVAENGPSKIFFYSFHPGKTVPWYGLSDFQYISSSIKTVVQGNRRALRWVDETGTTHQVTPGTGYDDVPIHHIGYLESTDRPPSSTHTPSSPLYYIILQATLPTYYIPLNLWIRSGDYTLGGHIRVKEYLNMNKNPTWGCVVTFDNLMENTSGGAIPDSVADGGNYIPVNTSNF